MSHHQAVRHKLQDGNRRRPQIHVPNRDVRRPVCIGAAWKPCVHQPHFFAEYRLRRYPDRDHQQHHTAEASVKHVGLPTPCFREQQDVHRPEIQHQLDTCECAKRSDRTEFQRWASRLTIQDVLQVDPHVYRGLEHWAAGRHGPKGVEARAHENPHDLSLYIPG